MLNPEEQELVAFVQQFAVELPVRTRIRVYRGLAECLKPAEMRAVFISRAAILEDADRRCRELNFTFTGGAK